MTDVYHAKNNLQISDGNLFFGNIMIVSRIYSFDESGNLWFSI